MDNSVGVSMLEWVVTNPENTPRQSLASVKFLVGAIRELAADNGYGVTLTSAKQEALIRLYKREGFEETDSGMTHLLAFNPLKKT